MQTVKPRRVNVHGSRASLHSPVRANSSARTHSGLLTNAAHATHLRAGGDCETNMMRNDVNEAQERDEQRQPTQPRVCRHASPPDARAQHGG